MKRFLAALNLFFALVVVPAASATTYQILPDGTGDFPTIQTGIDGASSGDTLSLGDGTFSGVGNMDLDFAGKQLVVHSQSGVAAACVLDCQLAGRGFIFQSGEDSASVVDGITIRNGDAPDGGAILCLGGSSPTISRCVLRWNTATNYLGGAIACIDGSSPIIADCSFVENDGVIGGGISCENLASPTITDCSFTSNSAYIGGGICCWLDCTPVVTRCVFSGQDAGAGTAMWLGYASSSDIDQCTFFNNGTPSSDGVLTLIDGSAAQISGSTFAVNYVRESGVIDVGDTCALTLSNSIIALSTSGKGIECGSPYDVTLTCCNIYDNADGDWTGCIADQSGIDGNITVDPVFCDPVNGNFTLGGNSPCAPDNNPECGLIGAWPVGCVGGCTVALAPTRIMTYYPAAEAFPVEVHVGTALDLGAFEICAGFDDAVLDLAGVVIDLGFLGSTGREVVPTDPVPCDPSCQAAGILFGAYTTGGQPGASGEGLLATLSFDRLSDGAGQGFLCLEGGIFETTATPPDTMPVFYFPNIELFHRSFCYGDFNDNGVVSIVEIMEVAVRWGCEFGHDCYELVYDVNLLEPDNYSASSPDSSIDVVDVQSVAARWGQGCPGTAPAAESTESIAPQALLNEPSTWLRISPEHLQITGKAGDTGTFTLEVEDVHDLGAFEASLVFDPSVVWIEDVEISSFMESTGRSIYVLEPQIDNENGALTLGAWSLGDDPGPEGSGSLAQVTVSIQSCPDITDIEVTEAVVTDTRGWPQPLGGMEGGTVATECLVPTTSPFPALPSVFALMPSRPNPFEHSTKIPFAIPSSSREGASVELLIVDASGRIVRRLTAGHGPWEPGEHEIVWDGRDDGGIRLPSGAYFCRFRAGVEEFKKQIVLVE